ncbi:hypothetical protein HMPREF1624_04184 [Sporothrix schenckii ATCC 58251]|uniref:Major facilitator superfamily (MFS) profile domain-containing protein n=1 Tax=Sporothrix schenckii (strain ATCC 58251 / de Perez 2211183) TaxID=1391915 RepID=U7PW82_SPOS1|nr:hypothetical protein HMPREF1624_04184 [Sporothrix schenckii ATCC 58251]
MTTDPAQVETGEMGEKAAGHDINIDMDKSKIASPDGDHEAPAARGVQFDDIPAKYWLSYRFLGSAFSVVLLASSLFTNFNLPASALTVINEDLGHSPAYIWISHASTVVSCVGVLVMGRLSDILGRRHFLLGGQVFGVVGSAVCATASSIHVLVAGATLYGVATTTQLSFPFLIHELVPNKHRGVAQACITVLTLPFAGFGSVIARHLIQHSAWGWRWVYMINVVFNATTLLLLAVCYFPPALTHLHTNWTWKTELRKLDYGGIFIFTGLCVLILLGLNWGGSTYPWSDAHVLGPLVVGCVLIIVFALYETYMPLEQPILPIKLLKNRNYLAMVGVACVGQMAYFALAILWPQQIQYTFTTDNIKIGWMSLTSGLGLIVGMAFFGILLRFFGNTRLQLLISTSVLFAFLAALGGTTHKGENYAIAFTTMAAFFAGWMDIIAAVANGLVTEPGDLGLANGFLGSMKQLIGTVATSVYVAILSNRQAANLPRAVTEAALGAGLPASSLEATLAAVANGTIPALEAVPGMNAAIEDAVAGGIRTAWAETFSTVYYASLAFSGLGIIAAYFSTDIDALLNNYVNRRITGTEGMNVPEERTIKNTHVLEDE